MSKPTIEQKWRQQIEEVKTEARKLPHSRERDALLKKAVSLKPLPISANGCRPSYSSEMSDRPVGHQ
jgi:hypothetical protein